LHAQAHPGHHEAHVWMRADYRVQPQFGVIDAEVVVAV